MQDVRIFFGRFYLIVDKKHFCIYINSKKCTLNSTILSCRLIHPNDNSVKRLFVPFHSFETIIIFLNCKTFKYSPADIKHNLIYGPKTTTKKLEQKKREKAIHLGFLFFNAIILHTNTFMHTK